MISGTECEFGIISFNNDKLKTAVDEFIADKTRTECSYNTCESETIRIFEGTFVYE